jgi:AmiR/NasT family two-component response regulator
MENLQMLGIHQLIELLAQMTSKLTLNLATHNTGAIQQFEYDVSLLQSEINSRKPKENAKGSGTDKFAS